MASKGGFLGFKFGGSESIASKVRQSPNVTMISLTGLGQQKARNYGVDGKKGDVLSYLMKAAPASVQEISQNTQIDVRTVQNIVHEFAASNPPLVVIGGKGG